MIRRGAFAFAILAVVAASALGSHSTSSIDAQSAASFLPVDIGAIANHSLDWLNNPPSGSTTLGGVPFTLRSGDRAVFMTAQRFLESLPTEGTARLATAVPAASVRILLTGGYTLQEFRNRQVGQIVLSFSDGSQQTTPIIAWQNVREAWCYERDIAGTCSMSPPSGNFRFQNVFTESQNRGGASARAFLDMLTIPVSTTTASLTSITVRDTSPTSVGSADPSLQVAGITVETLSTTSPSTGNGGSVQPPPPGGNSGGGNSGGNGGLRLTITVDRGEASTYANGDPITTCVTVSQTAAIRITDTVDGVAGPALDFGTFSGQQCKSATISPPLGSETLRADAVVNGQIVASAEVHYRSTGSPGSGGGGSSPILPPDYRLIVPPPSQSHLTAYANVNYIVRGSGQSDPVSWYVSESGGVGVTILRRTWQISGCLDDACLAFTNPLYGTESASVSPSLRVQPNSVAGLVDYPGAAGCGSGYGVTRLSMTFIGVDDNAVSVSATASILVRCVTGPQDLGPPDIEGFCQQRLDQHPQHAYLRGDGVTWYCSSVAPDSCQTTPGAGSICAFDPYPVTLDQPHMDDVCKLQSGYDDAYARQTDPGDPSSWRCYR